MRLTTNDKLVTRQSKIARYATFAGLAVLLGSLVLSFNSTSNILLSYVALFVGFVLAMIGSTLANKWIREPRADTALDKALKGLDNKYHLFNYLLPVEHACITPTGVLVFKVKPLDGQITLKDGKWSRPWQWSRLFGAMGQEGLGNPIQDLNNEITVIKDWLANKVDNAAMVPVDGYVVFTYPNTQLALDDANLPVVKAEDLKDTLRKSKRGTPLPQTTLDALERVFQQAADAKATK